jgi:hypothetical protein
MKMKKAIKKDKVDRAKILLDAFREALSKKAVNKIKRVSRFLSGIYKVIA